MTVAMTNEERAELIGMTHDLVSGVKDLAQSKPQRYAMLVVKVGDLADRVINLVRTAEEDPGRLEDQVAEKMRESERKRANDSKLILWQRRADQYDRDAELGRRIAERFNPHYRK